MPYTVKKNPKLNAPSGGGGGSAHPSSTKFGGVGIGKYDTQSYVLCLGLEVYAYGLREDLEILAKRLNKLIEIESILGGLI